jgi:ankyrin repeat protein
MAQILLACGANINARSMGGSFPLHLASSIGHIEVVKLLLANGADIDLQNNNHETALQIAIIRSQSSTKSLLLAHKSQASTVRAALPSHHVESTTTPLDGSVDVSFDADTCQGNSEDVVPIDNGSF